MISTKQMSDSWSVENVLEVVGFILFSEECKLGKKFIL
jgi:hypothetical protein